MVFYIQDFMHKFDFIALFEVTFCLNLTSNS